MTGSSAQLATAAEAGGALWALFSASVSGSTFAQTAALGGASTGGAIHAGASAVVRACHFSLSTAGGSGGAVAARGGAVAIAGSSFTDCAASLSGGSADLSGVSSLEITASTFTRSRCTAASCTGGAVSFASAALPAASASVADSTFTGPSAQGDGGGLFMNASALHVARCAFAAASSAAGRGGALFASASAAVASSSFQSCSASQSGGAAFFLSAAAGAASISSSQFQSCSSSSGSGGAVASSTALPGSTAPGAAALTVTGSLFASNSAPSGSGGAVAAPSLTSSGNTFRLNSAGSGGAVALPSGGLLSDAGSAFASNQAVAGGCVYLWGLDGQPLSAAAALVNTTFSACAAVTPSAHGGAVAAFAAALSLSGCSFDACAADTAAGATGALQCLARLSPDSLGRGGAVFALQSALSASASNFTGCWAGAGGAVFLSGAASTLDLSASLLSGNAARGNGTSGALFTSSFRGVAGTLGDGGAVSASGVASAAVSSTAFVNNSAVGSGGACDLAPSGALQLTAASFTSNRASVLGGALRASAAAASLSADAATRFANNSAGLAGGAAFFQMPAVASSASRPSLPACLQAACPAAGGAGAPPACSYGACVGPGNSAALYGPGVATNLTQLLVAVNSTTRTGTSLAARVSLADGFGHVASWWPETVVVVSCPSGPCPALTGILRASYDSSAQLLDTTLSSNPKDNPTFALQFQATSPWLPNWSPSTSAAVQVLPCRFLEVYNASSGTCDCALEAIRTADGSCNCAGATGANGDLTACVDCAPGTYSTSEFQFCRPCETGLVAPRTGMTACVACPLHSAAVDPTQCGARTRRFLPSFRPPLDSSPSPPSLTLHLTPPPFPPACLAGYSGDIKYGNVGECVICPADTFQNSSTSPSSACSSCPENSRTAPGLAGAVNISFCKSDPGFYMPQPGVIEIAPLVRGPELGAGAARPACGKPLSQGAGGAGGRERLGRQAANSSRPGSRPLRRRRSPPVAQGTYTQLSGEVAPRPCDPNAVTASPGSVVCTPCPPNSQRISPTQCGALGPAQFSSRPPSGNSAFGASSPLLLTLRPGCFRLQPASRALAGASTAHPVPAINVPLSSTKREATARPTSASLARRTHLSHQTWSSRAPWTCASASLGSTTRPGAGACRRRGASSRPPMASRSPRRALRGPWRGRPGPRTVPHVRRTARASTAGPPAPASGVTLARPTTPEGRALVRRGEAPPHLLPNSAAERLSAAP